MDILGILEHQLNFTSNIYVRMDHEWGNIDKSTGKWDGMISNLLDGSADLIANPMSITVPRSKVINFLPSLTIEEDAIIIKNTGSEENG
jgi:ABC-type amino acid transport substrate-binding protein